MLAIAAFAVLVLGLRLMPALLALIRGLVEAVGVLSAVVSAVVSAVISGVDTCTGVYP